MASHETADIRKALDRLQSSFEVLGDRYRDLRRERKILREQIEELQKSRESAEIMGSSQLEMAENDRRRAIEFEERAITAERRYEDIYNRVSDLERQLAEREALLAEREDAYSQLRIELDARGSTHEEIASERDKAQEEAVSLRARLQQIAGEIQLYQTRQSRLESDQEQDRSRSATQLNEAMKETSSLTAIVAKLKEEYGDLEEKHLQAIGKLDAATRAEAMARTDVARLQDERQAVDDSLRELHEKSALLEASLRQQQQLIERAGADAGGIEGRENEIHQLHATMEKLESEHATQIAALQEQLSQVDLERERLESLQRDLRRERDEAQGELQTLRERLSRLESSDVEQDHQRYARIEEMGAEIRLLNERGAQREKEMADAGNELERLQSRVAELTRQVEHLESASLVTENGVSTSGYLSNDERRKLADDIDMAIRLIDQQLENEAE